MNDLYNSLPKRHSATLVDVGHKKIFGEDGLFCSSKASMLSGLFGF